MNSILKLGWKAKWMLSVSIIAGIIGGFSNLYLLYFLQYVNSQYTLNEFSIWFYFGAGLVMLFTSLVNSAFLIRITQNAVFNLQSYIYERVLLAPLLETESEGSSSLLSTLSEDLNEILRAVPGIPTVIMNSIIIAICICYLFYISHFVFFVATLITCIGLIAYIFPVMRGQRYLVKARKDQEILFKQLKALSENIKSLKLNKERKISFIEESIKKSSEHYQENSFRGYFFYYLATSSGRLLIFLMLGLLFYIFQSENSEQTKSTLTSYSLILLYLSAPVFLVLAWIPGLGRGLVSIHKIKSLLSSLSKEPKEKEFPNKIISNIDFKLILKDISFSYKSEIEKEQFSLKSINMEIHSGEIIFICGGNGSGKSTLAKLICGLYKPNSGVIKIDGSIIDDGNREQYRNLYSVIFSDHFLLESLPFKKLGNYQDYFQRFKISQFLNSNDSSISIEKMSIGQRSRLALISILLEDRSIYIFDEWASHQDKEARKIFYYEILKELKEKRKMVFVITHDEEYFSVADHIFKLTYGELK